MYNMYECMYNMYVHVCIFVLHNVRHWIIIRFSWPLQPRCNNCITRFSGCYTEIDNYMYVILLGINPFSKINYTVVILRCLTAV